MTVFVVQKPRIFRDRVTGMPRLPDLSPATPFGPISYIFDDTDHPSLTPAEALQKCRKVLADFGDDDYLLTAGGDPAGIIAASMVAAAVNRGRVKYLRWERNNPNSVAPDQSASGGYYIPVDFRLNP
jgi:hypothetical protein